MYNPNVAEPTETRVARNQPGGSVIRQYYGAIRVTPFALRPMRLWIVPTVADTHPIPILLKQHRLEVGYPCLFPTKHAYPLLNSTELC